MRIPFIKLHGARNDFLLTVPALMDTAPSAGDLPGIAAAICERHTGVGADGWMLVDTEGGPGYDASIRLFNSDGSEPELSGNGTRCAAALLARTRPDSEQFRILTGAGIKHLRLIERKGSEFWFEMNMGDIRVLELRTVVEGHDAVIVNAGNPQCAIPVDNFDFDWRALGAAVERNVRFPDRTNVSFVRPVNDHTIEVRFWERGAGETNSSGTGSTGAAVAAAARGLVKSPVTVETPAGPLLLRFEQGIRLTGPAEFVFEGTYFYGKMGNDEIRTR